MTIRPFKRTVPKSATITLAVLITAIATACGGSSDDSAQRSGVDKAADPGIESAADGRGDAAGSNESSLSVGRPESVGQAATPVAALPAQQPLRLRAVSGDLTVRISADDELGESLSAANTVVRELNGFVFAQDSTFGKSGSATITYKLPPDNFNAAVDRLSELGTAVTSDINTSDVTDQVVDLDARIKSADASVSRVRALLADATNLGEVTSLEGELTRRETTLEQLVGQRRQTIDTVEMSTLTLTLNRTAKPPAVATEESWLASLPGFGSALQSGWNAFSSVVRVLLAGLGYALPFLAVAALLVGSRRVLHTRRPLAVGRDGEI